MAGDNVAEVTARTVFRMANQAILERDKRGVTEVVEGHTITVKYVCWRYIDLFVDGADRGRFMHGSVDLLVSRAMNALKVA